MKVISHRGNLFGKEPLFENTPTRIEKAISFGYDVEVDVWYHNSKWFLGHDKPQYPTSIKWLQTRYYCLWIHCKNSEALFKLVQRDTKSFSGERLNYFWHEGDKYTLTSHGFIWAYPQQQLKGLGVSVLTECSDQPQKGIFGICTDYPLHFVPPKV